MCSRIDRANSHPRRSSRAHAMGPGLIAARVRSATIRASRGDSFSRSSLMAPTAGDMVSQGAGKSVSHYRHRYRSLYATIRASVQQGRGIRGNVRSVRQEHVLGAGCNSPPAVIVFHGRSPRALCFDIAAITEVSRPGWIPGPTV